MRLLLVLSLAAAAQATEILWDRYGIPHIFAPNLNEAGRAFGWAQAHSHGNLLLRLYGQARGRGAEYWGKEYLDADRWVVRMRAPEIAAEWLRAQKPEYRAYLAAFAGGVNAYAHRYPGRLAEDVGVVLPVRPEDVLAHVLRVIHFQFVARPSRYEERWRRAGSNTWAVAPRRTTGGHALLLANPHLGWSDFYTWYEAQFTAPGLDAYGATLAGMPMPAIAFNDHLGWSHTVNTYDGADLFELTTEEGGYRFDGKVRPFEVEERVLKVRGAGPERLILKRSVHGPVVAEKAGKALALRVAGLDQPHLLEQYFSMLRARNLREFEAALSRLQIPMFTVMYADREGHILHLFGGRVPVRPRGDWQYWSGVVPGDTAQTLWTRTHAYSELPRVLDPPGGWLQNANDPPWTTTWPPPLKPSAFPPYMAPLGMSFRPQRSARMLAEDDRISFDEFVAYKHSTRSELADRMLADLVAAARQSGRAAAERAAAVLERWDRCTDAASRGAVLFENFARRWYEGPRPWAVPWNLEEALTTPRGIADPAAAVRALETAAEAVEQAHGSLDVAWGEVYRLRRDGLDLPANGGPDYLGIFRVVGYRREGNVQVAAGGDSYVAAIEFSAPLRAQALIGYGNASQPGSPHRTDQLELFARKQLRPVWRTRKEIEAHLEERLVLP